MPELPEVETVRRGLVARVVGRRIDDVEVTGTRTVRRSSAGAVRDGLRGARLVGADRRGKYLLCPLDTDRLLVVHLRMSGQLVLSPAGSARPAHTHVVLLLDGGEELRFVDPRTFGEVVVVDPDRLDEQAPDVAALGVDALDELDRATLRRLLAGRRRQLKALLLDQRVIAGLGNIYSDEVLHRARLRPERRCDTVGARQVGVLHRAIADVLGEAVDAGGSTLGDGQYVDLMGEGGGYQLRHLVYGRAGELCRSCGRASIVRSTCAGRSTYSCPRCQR